MSSLFHTLEIRPAEDQDGEEIGYFDFTLADAGIGDLPWYDGLRFAAPPEEPIELHTNDIDGWAVVFADYSSTPVPLASERLRMALTRAGVDNVEWFATRLVDADDHPEAPLYFAMNIVGRVAAVDATASEFDRVIDVPGADIFDRLVLDMSRVAGLKLFRLVESATTVVVADDVRQALEAAGIDTLAFASTGPEALGEGESI